MYIAHETVVSHDASLDFGGQRAFSGISGAVVMFFEEVFYPVIEIIRDGQQCQLVHQSRVSDRVERLCEIKREDAYILVVR